ncbi:MAG: hypothetical protein GY755_11545 [Chloroflexi bacterium]|nr:hypothetical protein [Chloroflexota bacterium]
MHAPSFASSNAFGVHRISLGRTAADCVAVNFVLALISEDKRIVVFLHDAEVVPAHLRQRDRAWLQLKMVSLCIVSIMSKEVGQN